MIHFNWGRFYVQDDFVWVNDSVWKKKIMNGKRGLENGEFMIN